MVIGAVGDALRVRDAIVIGGGPAGCAFAIELARKGLDVLLIEKTGGPHHKVCGEFLSGDSLSLLQNLDIDVFATGAVRTNDLKILKGNRAAKARLPFPAAALSRYRLDEALLTKATASGVRVIRGELARAISQAADGLEVRTADARYLSRFVAVATGKHAMPGIKRPTSRIVGFRQALELDPTKAETTRGQVVLSVYRGGYQGLQMTGGSRATACWIVDQARAKALGADWSRHQAFLAGQSGQIADLLHGSRAMTARPLAIAGMPFGHLRRVAVSERVFAIGDQLGTIPSFAGDGIAIALGSGILAARYLAEGQTANRFHIDMYRSLKWQFGLARPVHSLMTHPAGQAIGMALLRLFPGLMSTLGTATRFDANLLGNEEHGKHQFQSTVGAGTDSDANPSRRNRLKG